MEAEGGRAGSGPRIPTSTHPLPSPRGLADALHHAFWTELVTRAPPPPPPAPTLGNGEIPTWAKAAGSRWPPSTLASSASAQVLSGRSAYCKTTWNFPVRNLPRAFVLVSWCFPGGSAGKESTCNARDLGSIPGLGRSSEEGKGYLARPGSPVPSTGVGSLSLLQGIFPTQG